VGPNRAESTLSLVEAAEIWFNTSYSSFLNQLGDHLSMAVKQTKLSRRTVALLWLVGVSIIIGTLIYLEQIAVLYVLTTLSLVALLLIVAFSDLERVGRENIEGFIRDE
jgi:hypothetical protein